MSCRVQIGFGVAFERHLKIALYFFTDHIAHFYSDWNLAIDV